MNKREPRVEVLSAGDAGDVGDVVSALSEAFFDYPVMRFVLGSPEDYANRLETLVTLFVLARVLRNEVLLGVRGATAPTGPTGLTGAAIVSFPGGGPSPPEFEEVREETWARLGEAARARYEAFGATTSQFEVEVEHIHLNMIGVRRSAQGQGVGRALLEAVHDLSASRESSAGVSLTTEVESNVSLYEHFGYEVIGSAPVQSAFTTWTMFRRDEGRRSES